MIPTMDLAGAWAVALTGGETGEAEEDSNYVEEDRFRRIKYQISSNKGQILVPL